MARTNRLAVLLEHRSPPLPLIARQAGERTVRLSATVNSHAAKTGAIEVECCRRRRPGHRRLEVAEGRTAHVLSSGLKDLFDI
jgi:hypothetical protein